MATQPLKADNDTQRGNSSLGLGCFLLIFLVLGGVFVTTTGVISLPGTPTLTITERGFDRTSDTEDDGQVVFKNDLSLPITLCMGMHQQCKPCIPGVVECYLGPEPLTSGLIIQPRSSASVSFSTGEYHITVATVLPKPFGSDLDLSITHPPAPDG